MTVDPCEVFYDIPNRILSRIWEKPLALQLYFYFRKYENIPVRYWTIKDFCERKFKTTSGKRVEDAILLLLSCGAITHVETNTGNAKEQAGGSFMMETEF